MHRLEEKFWEAGYRKIGGIDEVGRGPLAGPVVSAVVVIDRNVLVEGVKDSKKLSEKKRKQLFSLIKKSALEVSFGWVDEETIDQINIYQATILSMKQAVNNLIIKPDLLLVDGLHLPGLEIEQRKVVGGDRLCFSIAAASIMAKVARDEFMVAMHKKYPLYNFKQNKGYGTREHLLALRKYGPSPIHRKSFRGVKIENTSTSQQNQHPR